MNYIYNKSNTIVNVDAIAYVQKTSDGNADVVLLNDHVLTDFASFDEVKTTLADMSRRKTKIKCDEPFSVKVVNK